MSGPLESNRYGLAFYEGKWRYFEKYKPIKKGKRKGYYWIFFRNEGQRLVHPKQIKRMPTDPGQLRIFD
jgi:hypothetical protein